MITIKQFIPSYKDTVQNINIYNNYLQNTTVVKGTLFSFTTWFGIYSGEFAEGLTMLSCSAYSTNKNTCHLIANIAHEITENSVHSAIKFAFSENQISVPKFLATSISGALFRSVREIFPHNKIDGFIAANQGADFEEKLQIIEKLMIPIHQQFCFFSNNMLEITGIANSSKIE